MVTRRLLIAAATWVALGCLVISLADGRPHRQLQARVIHDAADTPDPLDILSASLRQDGRDLVVAVTTRKKWPAGALAGHGAGTLCLMLAHAGEPVQICLTGSGSSVSLTRGREQSRVKRTVPATVAYALRYVRARIALQDIGLAGDVSLSWQVRSKWSAGKRCPRNAACTDLAPDTTPAHFRIEAVRPHGCRTPRTGYFTSGSPRRRTVALTFDDGPGVYTREVLAVLERAHVPATFFLIGRQVGSEARVVRREVADGEVVGDHTWSHPDVSGGGRLAMRQIATTKKEIRRVTGFEPCLFRAPDGAVSGALVRVARAQGLATIGWNVDPSDWRRPGARAIYSRVVGAVRPGSIVVMHDGGGRRDQTVAALPRVISTLRSRGYDFATVPDLLGGGVVYGP
jgi:peptidoglycan/xylan/chitin deacetylase (PgdA/CDA1 family)